MASRPITDIVKELLDRIHEIKVDTPVSFVVNADDMVLVFKIRQRMAVKGFEWTKQETQHLDRVLSLLLNSAYITADANDTICEALDLLDARNMAKEETFNP